MLGDKLCGGRGLWRLNDSSTFHMKSSLCFLLVRFDASRDQIDLLSKIIPVISIDICPRRDITACNESNLVLLSLTLLARLFSSLFFLHLFITQGGQSAGYFLDLVTGKILGELLREFLKEKYVVSLFGIVCKNRDQSLAKLFELKFSLWIEKWEGCKIDGFAGVLGVDYNSVGSSSSFATVANSDIAK